MSNLEWQLDRNIIKGDAESITRLETMLRRRFEGFIDTILSTMPDEARQEATERTKPYVALYSYGRGVTFTLGFERTQEAAQQDYEASGRWSEFYTTHIDGTRLDVHIDADFIPGITVDLETQHRDGFMLAFPSRAYSRHGAAIHSRDESVIADNLATVLERDFEIEREVQGFHIPTLKDVKADLILMPRNHLVERGFDRVTLVVECKNPFTETIQHKTFFRGMAQVHSYLDCEFGEWGSPDFGLMYPGAAWFGLDQTIVNAGYYFRIGYLSLLADRWDDSCPIGWRLFVGGNVYFTMNHYRAKINGIDPRFRGGAKMPKAFIGSGFVGHFPKPKKRHFREGQTP